MCALRVEITAWSPVWREESQQDRQQEAEPESHWRGHCLIAQGKGFDLDSGWCGSQREPVSKKVTPTDSDSQWTNFSGCREQGERGSALQELLVGRKTRNYSQKWSAVLQMLGHVCPWPGHQGEPLCPAGRRGDSEECRKHLRQVVSFGLRLERQTDHIYQGTEKGSPGRRTCRSKGVELGRTWQTGGDSPVQWSCSRTDSVLFRQSQDPCRGSFL